MALNYLGAERSQRYGHTLIALVEQASHRGLLPVAVSLADTTYLLKRRLTMIAQFTKKSFWWSVLAILLLSAMALLALTSAEHQGSIKGTVTFNGDTQPDSVYVGVYFQVDINFIDRMLITNLLSEPEALFSSINKNFKFDVEPGIYIVAAWAFGYEPSLVYIIVPYEKTLVEIIFQLQPCSLPGIVSEIELITDFQDKEKPDWGTIWKKSFAMERDGK
jgi:hypothetical protein